MKPFAYSLSIIFEIIAVTLLVFACITGFQNHDWPMATFSLLLCFLAIWLALTCYRVSR